MGEGPGGGDETGADDSLGFVAEAGGELLLRGEGAVEDFFKDGAMFGVGSEAVGDASDFFAEVLRWGMLLVDWM